MEFERIASIVAVQRSRKVQLKGGNALDGIIARHGS